LNIFPFLVRAAKLLADGAEIHKLLIGEVRQIKKNLQKYLMELQMRPCFAYKCGKRSPLHPKVQEEIQSN
jgi:hypothetical protein